MRPSPWPWIAGCLALLLGAASVQAQQLPFRAYDQEDGLGNLTVLCLLQDRQGLLWACTENGLYRYDGFHFERQDPGGGGGDSEIVDAIEDARGRLWAATRDGVYVREGSRWQTVTEQSDALNIERGQYLARYGDAIVAINAQRLIRFREDGSGHWQAQSDLTGTPLAAVAGRDALGAVVGEAANTLWLACGTALCELRDGRLQVWAAAQGVPAERWSSLFVARDGTVWARSRAQIVALPAHARHFVARPVGGPDYPTATTQLPFSEDLRGRLLTSWAGGVARWNGEDWERFDTRNGLPAAPPNTMLIDREGSLWLGTNGLGAHRLLGFGQWQHWTTSQGLPSNAIWSMLRDTRNRLWVGTDLGLSEIAPGAPPQTPAGTPLREVYSMVRSRDGALWVSERSGRLQRYAADGGAQLVAELPRINRLALDADGRLLIASADTAYRLDPAAPDAGALAAVGHSAAGTVQESRLRDIAGDPERRRSLFVSRGNVYLLDARGWQTLRRADGGAASGYLSAAFAGDGSLWLGGDGAALQHFRIDGSVLRALGPPEANVVGTHNIVFVRRDRRDGLWIGTDVGVTHYDGQHWRRIDRGDGLIWNDCNEGAFFEDDDGSIWIGTSGGLSHLLDPAELSTPTPLQILIVAARHGRQSLDPRATADNSLPWARAALDVDLASPNFAAARTLRFRYRIVGLDEHWESTGSHELHFPLLPPGRYRLEVSAYDPVSGSGAPPATLSFRIAAPWWRTPWTALAALAILAALARLLLRWRLGVLLRRQRELERLVAERTAELERDKNELILAREALVERATRDSLTGLWNRAAILEILEREIIRAQRSESGLAVVMIDIDHFKSINDAHGHLVGDRVLRETAERLIGSVRPYDEVGRYGGEELLIVLPGLEQRSPHTRIEELHRAIAAQPYSIDGLTLNVGACFGVAWLAADKCSGERLLRAADQVLYEGKSAGRNCVRYAA